MFGLSWPFSSLKPQAYIMSSWLGWLFILGGLYIVVIVFRALIEFITWCFDEFFPEEPVGPEEQADGHLSESRVASASHELPARNAGDGDYAKWFLLFAARITLIHWLAPLAEFARMLVHKGQYDYWIGRALAEDN